MESRARHLLDVSCGTALLPNELPDTISQQWKAGSRPSRQQSRVSAAGGAYHWEQARTWVRPQGSNMEGTRTMSQPA